jgi:Bacterial antitoxin of type II TA system, VapB
MYGSPHMGSHMKTTIEISDALLRAAKDRAAKDGTTLRALVELGLRHVLEEQQNAPPFKLRQITLGGGGLTPEFRDGGWDKIRDAIYEGHGA